MEIFLKSSFHAGGAHGGVEGIALVLQFVILLFADGADIAQQMGRCAQQFEMLPILKDTPEGKLLYNTIYSGVWSKYALVRKHREAKRHD